MLSDNTARREIDEERNNGYRNKGPACPAPQHDRLVCFRPIELCVLLHGDSKFCCMSVHRNPLIVECICQCVLQWRILCLRGIPLRRAYMRLALINLLSPGRSWILRIAFSSCRTSSNHCSPNRCRSYKPMTSVETTIDAQQAMSTNAGFFCRSAIDVLGKLFLLLSAPAYEPLASRDDL